MRRILSFLLLTTVLLIGVSFYKGNSHLITAGKDLNKYTSQILEKCSSFAHRQSCYDKEIPVLMEDAANLTMEEAFEITKLVQEKDNSFPYCHVLGHNLSAKEVKKDPSKWKDVLSRCPSGVCSNGCIHGGFQERFRAESFTDKEVEAIKMDLKTICEKRNNWNPTGLEQASCYHALGHLTMYITEADTPYSIKLCDEIAVKEDGRSFLQVCLDGVFMQTFQPLEPEDFALISGKEVTKDQVDAFCSKFGSLPKASCLSESWPLYREKIMESGDELIKFCSKEEKADQPRCFDGLFYVLTAQFNFDSDRIKDYCLNLPVSLQGKCFANTASRMIETDYRNIDKSIKLCYSVSEKMSQEECFNELLKYSTYNFHAGSTEFIKLCNGLPAPWRNKCLN